MATSQLKNNRVLSVRFLDKSIYFVWDSTYKFFRCSKANYQIAFENFEPVILGVYGVGGTSVGYVCSVSYNPAGNSQYLTITGYDPKNGQTLNESFNFGMYAVGYENT